MKFECPHCKQQSLSLKDKLLAGKWATITCRACGGRSCAQPILLAVLFFFYIWDVVLFGYVAFVKYQVGDATTAAVYAAVMVIGWLVLEAIGLYIPLARMRAKA